MREGEGGVK